LTKELTEIIFAFEQHFSMKTQENEAEEMTPKKDDRMTIKTQNQESGFCEFNLEVKYPIVISNCLPNKLGFRLTKIENSMIEDDTLSKISLSRLGKALDNRGDEIYSRCFKDEGSSQFKGEIAMASKTKLIGVSAETFPLLTLESEGVNSKSFIKLQKYLRRGEKGELTQKGVQDIGTLVAEVGKETQEKNVWQENRVHHVYSSLSDSYTNVLVNTSKLYHLHKVNVSAQFWILNELLNQVDIQFSEGTFTYDRLSVHSSYDDMMAADSNLDELTISQLKSSSIVDDMNLELKLMDTLFCTQNYQCVTDQDKEFLCRKSKSIKTFTGKPFDNNKSKLTAN
jgi:hypothetical protein